VTADRGSVFLVVTGFVFLIVAGSGSESETIGYHNVISTETIDVYININKCKGQEGRKRSYSCKKYL